MGQQHALSKQQQTTTDTASEEAVGSARAPVTATLLALQTTAGNRAVARAVQTRGLAPRATATSRRRAVARATGLRRATDVSAFADDALAFWGDKANKDKPLEDYAKHLMTKVNALLADMSFPPSKYVIDHAGSDSGTFSRVTWTITINPDKFSSRQNVTKVGELTADEAAEIADTIYHESRHAEQYFRIARVQAGRMKKGTKDPGAKIAAAMSIPLDIAKAAVKLPLTAGPGLDDLIAEAENWESITVGFHADYKGNINVWGDEADELDDAVEGVDATSVDAVKAKVEATLSDWKKDKDRLKFLKSHLAKTKKVKRQTEMDKRVIQYLTDIKAKLDALSTAASAALKKWDKADAATRLQRIEGLKGATKALRRALYAAYKGHIHEEDAWATGGAVGARFRSEELAQRKAREKAEKEAAAKKKAAKKNKVKGKKDAKAPEGDLVGST